MFIALFDFVSDIDEDLSEAGNLTIYVITNAILLCVYVTI
jgi:hypothetical protein